MFILFLRERERERAWGRGKREWNRRSKAGCGLTAERLLWDSNSQWDHDLSLMLNQPSHPGTPHWFLFWCTVCVFLPVNRYAWQWGGECGTGQECMMCVWVCMHMCARSPEFQLLNKVHREKSSSFSESSKRWKFRMMLHSKSTLSNMIFGIFKFKNVFVLFEVSSAV